MSEPTAGPAGGPLYGVIPALLTPMDARGERLDLPAARELVGRLVASGVHALYALGTTGEAPLLTTAERQAFLEAILPVAGRVPVGVQVGALSTTEACALARHAAQAGAAAVAAIPPSYYAVTPREILEYYRAIARAAAPLPLYLYNIPSHARNDLKPAFVRDLREAIPAVAGIKDSTGNPDRVKQLVRALGAGFGVINGNDELDLASLQGGACGVVASGAGIFPDLYLGLYAAWREGRTPDAEVAQRKITTMQERLGNGARLGWYKEVWRLRGLPLGGVRAPLLGPTPAEAEAIRESLALLGLE
jgi:4-hydroxy-tetrahydrodipicolinate synthase